MNVASTGQPRGSGRQRLVGAVLIAVVLAAGTGYVGWRIAGAAPPGGAALRWDQPGTLVFVAADGRVRQVARDRPDVIIGSGPACQRAYAARGTLACLRPAAIPGGHEVAVFNADLTERVVIPVWGTPSRVRSSSSGRLLAWTVFRSGDSYLNGGAFSTTAGAYDLTTGDHWGSLEDFVSVVDGRGHTARDRNFWGITIGADDRTFYATMASGGHTWLMRGDFGTRRMTALRENVECPSLSPDGRRIAYKARVGARWRLSVLDLATGVTIPLGEPDHVDDQPAWLDGELVAYAKPVGGKPVIFTVAADGTGGPRRLRDGSSPGAPR